MGPTSGAGSPDVLLIRALMSKVPQDRLVKVKAKGGAERVARGVSLAKKSTDEMNSGASAVSKANEMEAGPVTSTGLVAMSAEAFSRQCRLPTNPLRALLGPVTVANR